MNTSIKNTIKALQKNNFEVYYAVDTQTAKDIFLHTILPKIEITSASYGDSMTMHKCGVLEVLKNRDDIEFIDTFDPKDERKERIQKRKKALTADLFITGTNALTEEGCLVNLDMVGNRVAPIIFGPDHVVLFIGKNKIVKDRDEAFKRIKEFAAPQNAIRHKDFKLACQKTASCHDCNSKQRICNCWSITEKSFPKGRIKIILINEKMGL